MKKNTFECKITSWRRGKYEWEVEQHEWQNEKVQQTLLGEQQREWERVNIKENNGLELYTVDPKQKSLY